MSGALAIVGGKPVREKMLPLAEPYFDTSDEEAVAERIRSTFVIGDGPKCKEFERAFASYLGVKHALLTTSCTAALDLALKAAQFQDGEAIVPDYTFTSTALAPLLNTMSVKLCDVNPETGNMEADMLQRSMTPKTRCVIPVDYAGRPCDIETIVRVAQKNGSFVLLDAAQSCGSRMQGKLVGTQADATCFSFHATKNLVTGEGGCLVTNDDGIAERARIIREKGIRRGSPEERARSGFFGFFECAALGNSYVQSDILGALALSQLTKLDSMNARRRAHAADITAGIRDLPFLRIPTVPPGIETNQHLFLIHVPVEKQLWVRSALRAEGIECDTHYRPLHEHAFYKKLLPHLGPDAFPGSSHFSRTLLRLPMFPALTDGDKEDIIQAVRKVFLSPNIGSAEVG